MLTYEVINMRMKKLMLAAAALFALAVAYVRPVCTVSLAGRELPGVWAVGDLAPALSAASAAAEEISRIGGGLPEPETHVSFSLLPASGGETELALTLLAEAPGVEQAWDVTVDGVPVGRTSDRSALGEVLLAAIAEAAPADSLRTGFDSDIELQEVYAPAGSSTDLMELSGRIRSLVRVSYVTSDGELRYA